VGDEYKSFDWDSTIAVSAVIVKAGTKAYVYEYNPAVKNDTYLYAPEIGASAMLLSAGMVMEAARKLL